MSREDRKTLKKHFSDGALPTAQHFGDLVDSMVTWKDDGFDKSPSEGWRISALGEERALMSFYAGVGASVPVWTMKHGEVMKYGEVQGTLEFRPGSQGGATARVAGAEPLVALSLTSAGQMGVNTADPAWRLDVDGTARMRGRLGFARPGEQASVPADGNWHDITEPMEGCHALEVMAGAGGAVGEGHYAMLHAVAMNAYHPRNPILNWLFNRRSIRNQTAIYGGYADRLRLRWETVGKATASESSALGRDRKRAPGRFNRPYKLQIRTNADFGNKSTIRYYVTRLWFDSQMAGSRAADIDRDPGAM